MIEKKIVSFKALGNKILCFGEKPEETFGKVKIGERNTNTKCRSCTTGADICSILSAASAYSMSGEGLATVGSGIHGSGAPNAHMS